jgi:hypothetical protein
MAFFFQHDDGSPTVPLENPESERERIILLSEFSPSMPASLLALLFTLGSILRSRLDLHLEILALRHQTLDLRPDYNSDSQRRGVSDQDEYSAVDQRRSHLQQQRPNSMRRLATVFLLLALEAWASGQGPQDKRGVERSTKSPLDVKIAHLDVTNAILRDGISELSLSNIEGLHLGFEEIIRGNIQDDPRALSTRFSLHLQDKSVREILEALCQADERYTWSEDETSINVFPRAAKSDPSYLLNLRIDNSAVSDIPDPNQGLTPLSKRFPEQQVGYYGGGGEDSYAERWTSGAEFRPLISRLGPAIHRSKECQEQAEELVALSAGLTDRQKVIAEFSNDGPNTEQPPGHWALFARWISERDHHSLDDEVKMLFVLSNATFDAGIAAWDAKREYDSVRPVTAIPFLFRDKTIRAWGGPREGTIEMDGSQWIPYQAPTFPTPPFPGYVSGHSTYSAAAAIPELWIGNDHFGDSVTLPAGSSKIEPGVTLDLRELRSHEFSELRESQSAACCQTIHRPTLDNLPELYSRRSFLRRRSSGPGRQSQ